MILNASDLTLNVAGNAVQTFNYDDIAREVCQNVDDRIKFLAILLPICWMLGNWLYNKCHDGKFIEKHFSQKIVVLPLPAWGLKTGKWYEVELMSGKDIVLEFIVPILRAILMYGFGFLVYYTQIAGLR